MKLLWVVPESMRKSIVVKFHDLAGHFALERTVLKIMERYYFPRMRRYVRYHIQSCTECVINKVPRGKRPGELHPVLPGKRPFEIVNLDHIGPLVRSTAGNSYILVAIDNLTKYVKLYTVKDCGTKEVIKSLNSFIQDCGLPKRLVSDRGTAFTSKLYDEFCAMRGIRHSLISVGHLQAKGQIERVNSTLVPVIQSNKLDDRHWDTNIKRVESQLNNAHNKTIGDTPFHILYGYYPSFEDVVLRHATNKEERSDTVAL